MSAPPVLDVPSLLKPISDDQPAGNDLRQDTSPRSTYYAIRDARNQARTAERQAQMNGESPLGAGDWSPLVQAVPDVLQQASKDLEFTAYLIEALARTNGFAGLRDGFRLARELVSQFGDVAYPLPDEDGIETRVAALTGLNGADSEGTLVGPIRNIPLTDRNIEAYSTSDYEQALDLEHAAADKRERRIAQGAVPLAKIQTAIAQTSTPYLVQLSQDIDECLAEYNAYVTTLDEKYGHDAPPSSNILTALQRCKEVLRTLAGDRIKAATPAAAAADASAAAVSSGNLPSSAAGVAAAGPAPGTIGPIRSRDDAFQQLQQIAEYFRQAEPHTPVTFAIEQAVRWGKLPLPDLLRELIPDPNSVQQMFRLVGIAPTDQNR